MNGPSKRYGFGSRSATTPWASTPRHAAEHVTPFFGPRPGGREIATERMAPSSNPMLAQPLSSNPLKGRDSFEADTAMVRLNSGATGIVTTEEF